MGQPAEFIAAVFGDTFPEGCRAALWDKAGGKRSIYLDGPADADQMSGRPDIYVSASLVGPTVTSPKLRVKARDSVGIGGLWLDVDLPGPEDPPTKRPAPDKAAALDLLGAAVEPTVIVHSGYGIQAWWLFDDVKLFGSNDEREQAARVAQGWEVLHRNRARNHGFDLDSVHDLARVMRLPGTLNAKGGTTVPVEIVEIDGPRYDWETLAQHALLHAPINVHVEGASITVDAEFPQRKFDALMELDESFRRTFDHTRKDRAAEGWSDSEYDMALASMAAGRGWTDDEIAALITYHRRKLDPTDEKATRKQYLEKTVGRARTDKRKQERNELRADALGELASMSDNGTPPDPDKVFGLFNGIIAGGQAGAPVVRELVQYSKDPDQARFVFVLADGEEVNVGPYENLREPRKLDRRIGPATQFVMEAIKDGEEWRDALRTILRVCHVREEPEPPVLEWVKRYIEDNISGDRDEAAKGGAPFERDGKVHVRAEGLSWFVKTVLRERVGVASADLRPALQLAGFEQVTVTYKRESGGRSKANYFVIDRKEIA
jgi:hypothetical protein